MEPTFVMMIGLSGSGKSEAAKNYTVLNGGKIFSSDDIRKEIYGDENCQDNHARVFEILEGRVRAQLSNGKNAVYDATNLVMKRRINFLKTIKSINCKKICYLVATPFSTCIKRDSNRKRSVGYNVIKRQREKFQVPHFYEGWDEIIILNEEKMKIDELEKQLRDLQNVSHDNPHHDYSIGQHMLEAQSYCERLAVMAFQSLNDPKTSEKKKIFYKKAYERWLFLAVAARYHDLGKGQTKAFKNFKGESTDIAHFYNHQNVSSYEIISHIGGGILKPTNNTLYGEKINSLNYWLNIAVIACWHMQPFLLKAETAKEMKESIAWNKFIEKVGKEMEELLFLFHSADLNSH